MAAYLTITLVVSVGFNLLLFFCAFKRRTDKLTDISYALTFIFLAMYGLLRGPNDGGKLVLAALVALWAMRLGSFLLRRIWKVGTDRRFDAMRNNFWAFGRFWLLQGVSVWVILLAALLAFNQPSLRLTVISFMGIAIWLTGLCLEATADLQKYRFSQNPNNKGKWIASGVWSWSRHPNYFGEILVWVGVYLCVLPSLPAAAAFVGALSPLYIICLLVFVSGLPPLEKSADERWGKDQAYKQYKRRTSILVPRPPRR